jgi:short-subunit dehydrogenase
MSGVTWIVLGASSAMGRAFARAAAARGADVALAGRDEADLAASAADIRLTTGRGAEVWPFDARDPASHRALAKRAAEIAGEVSVAVFVGSMPDQAEIDADPGLAAGVIADNYAGLVSALHRLAPVLEAQGSGSVVGVGSVAGDRGRLKNYVYGSAKAGFHTYLAGLRNRLGRSGVHVLTVKPGFVDTAMTWGAPGMFLVAAPEDVATAIFRALDRRWNVVYAPLFWLGIMTIFRLIPERVFKKLSV